MDHEKFWDRSARLALFYERLQAAPACRSHDSSYALLSDTLNGVENEYSGIENNPDNWQSDGRLYPPQPDRAYRVDGFSGVIRYKNFKHETYIANNGAIEIRVIDTNEIIFSKLGADGKGVWE